MFVRVFNIILWQNVWYIKKVKANKKKNFFFAFLHTEKWRKKNLFFSTRAQKKKLLWAYLNVSCHASILEIQFLFFSCSTIFHKNYTVACCQANVLTRPWGKFRLSFFFVWKMFQMIQLALNWNFGLYQAMMWMEIFDFSRISPKETIKKVSSTHLKFSPIKIQQNTL